MKDFSTAQRSPGGCSTAPRYTVGSKKYFAVNTGLNWNDAKANCETTYGGKILQPVTDAEMAAAKTNIVNCTYE